MVIMKEKLIEMVKKGVPDREIMKELGIQTRASLRRMYYEALVEAGKIKDILTERELRKGVRGQRAVTIGKRGTILLSRKLLVDRHGFKTGDTFSVAKRRDSIILRKMA
ncbi:MAG: hypothetical protein KAJ09_07835 [Deltaproteobacteria bacterium]|nr:hypothetical protein [Deltaproteobacteria bacterium]